MDLALARGGDQVVIKDVNGITYYGGKREQTAKSTRVKARVKAEALRETIIVHDKIFVMGHNLPDIDVFGAAIGLYKATQTLDKEVHIVLGEINASLRPMFDLFRRNEDYPEDMFVSGEWAKAHSTSDSLLIIVDVNRPSMTDCPELLSHVRSVAVFDHHRQSSDYLDNAVLSYIEPHASSTCEMVAELLQYIPEEVQLSDLEASSMYAGIMIDTNNFINRTGVRTFEAAAYLRRNGADIPMLHKLFRDDMEAYRARAEIISSVNVYKKRFAIACAQNLTIESPTIIGAQAANELLDISDIQASFVLTAYKGRIYVSARSIGDINVQVLMEKLGGGGHLSAAGAQFEHTDMEAAVAALKNVIDVATKADDI